MLGSIHPSKQHTTAGCLKSIVTLWQVCHFVSFRAGHMKFVCNVFDDFVVSISLVKWHHRFWNLYSRIKMVKLRKHIKWHSKHIDFWLLFVAPSMGDVVQSNNVSKNHINYYSFDSLLWMIWRLVMKMRSIQKKQVNTQICDLLPF